MKNSTLAIMDILVTIKEELAALREDTQDVKRELATVKEDTQDVRRELETAKQNTNSALAGLKEDTQCIKTDVERLRQNTDSALQDLKMDLVKLNQDSQCDTSSPVTECDPLISVQYLPTSCSELAASSPSGYYWIYNHEARVYCDFSVTSQQDPALSCEHIATHHPLTPSGYYWIYNYDVRVYCDFSVTSQQNPAPSCEHIATHYPYTPSGYYWVESSNGSAVNVYCYSQQDPAPSCQYIAETHPSAPSGYYWVRSSNGSAVNVYCDMARHCCGSSGGWMRVTYLDMTDTSQQCPEGFRLRSEPNRTCELIATCTSILYPSHHIRYSKVCGRVRAYQYGVTIAFTRYYRGYDTTIDSNYVGGMSITHGESPRKHIWTFAAALDETRYGQHVCPCTKTDTPYTGRVPPFIGNDYFCDTGSHQYYEWYRFYSEDPLWDGEGCGPTNSCCQFNSPPWFCKELPQPTTDDVEVRVCRYDTYSGRNIPFDLIELYIQ